MLGGYPCYQPVAPTGHNQWPSLLITAALMGLFRWLLERFCFRPLRGEINRVIVMSITIVPVLETSVNVATGVHTRFLPLFVEGVTRTGMFSVSTERTVTSIISAALLLGRTFFVRKVKTGQQMPAVAQDRVGGRLQGISIDRISMLACALGCSLASVAGS
ncbi:MAG: branched-chain amino acid ABC transporter permease [Syntrophorhabdales bacterium]